MKKILILLGLLICSCTIDNYYYGSDAGTDTETSSGAGGSISNTPTPTCVDAVKDPIRNIPFLSAKDYETLQALETCLCSPLINNGASIDNCFITITSYNNLQTLVNETQFACHTQYNACFKQ